MLDAADAFRKFLANGERTDGVPSEIERVSSVNGGGVPWSWVWGGVQRALYQEGVHQCEASSEWFRNEEGCEVKLI